MIARLTPEQVEAINAAPPDATLEMVDEESHKAYVLFDKAAYEAWVRLQVQAGLDDNADEEWDVESIKLEGRRRLEALRTRSA